MTTVARLPGSGQTRVLSGNDAAAYGVLLCHPDIICAYPITPQTPLMEKLSRFCADGVLDSDKIEVEGEHSALSILIGAASAGARTFTATSSQGLAYMYEAYLRASGLRLPMVMVVATREMDAPAVVASGEQDVMMVRNAGWVHLHAETCQEILDSVIVAYRLAEDPEVQLPVSVIYDGFYLSHLKEKVDIPGAAVVAAFLPALQRGSLTLDPHHPMSFPCRVPTGAFFTEFRYKHCAALQKVPARFDELGADLGRRLGRTGLSSIEEYRTADAEELLVALGSCAGTVKEVVDARRQEGIPVGLVKLRLFRPLPREALMKAFSGKKAIGVIDRNVCFEGNCGALFADLKGVLGDMAVRIPMACFIDGLAGSDITLEHISKAVDITHRAAQGEPFQETTWLAIE